MVQVANSYNWWIFRSQCGCIYTGYRQEGRLKMTRESKMTHKDFAILNSHVTVIYLRFIKSINFYEVKQKNLNWLCFSLLFILVYKMCLFSSKQTVSKIKWHLSESYVSKSAEKIENINCRKVLKYVRALNEESKRNLVLVTLGDFWLDFWLYQFIFIWS